MNIHNEALEERKALVIEQLLSMTEDQLTKLYDLVIKKLSQEDVS